ncbi:MAG: prolyl oligopeptidase family serine peptidase [Actinomycetota bacterium]|nr:prolyl oligopeptidase family serine peptidase [Actinomycetota bacterium]
MTLVTNNAAARQAHSEIESYPRQRARTRGFQLGRPRNFHITQSRVLFIRSSSGSDSAGSLWSVEFGTESTERCIVDVRSDLPFDSEADLPEAERARRERMREVTGGITAFSVNAAGSHAVFPVSGVPYLVDLNTGDLTTLPSPGPVVDPRIDSAGTYVAFVHEGSLYVVDLAKLEDGATCVAASTSPSESWGLADYIAAEELSRYQGHWWLSEQPGTLLTERADDAAVLEWWISDPAHPTNAPHAMRYPAAGTTNATIELWCINPSGESLQLTWDFEAYPYLASVNPGSNGTIVELLTRDQRTVSICRVDLLSHELVEIQSRTDHAWIDVMPGVPCITDANELLEILADEETDTYRLCKAGKLLTPAGLQLRGLVSHNAEAAIFSASSTATSLALYRITYATGAVEALTDETGWSGGSFEDTTSIVSAAHAFQAQTSFVVTHGHRTHEVVNHAESPNIELHLEYAVAGADQLQACILWPRGHVPGSRKLPVIMSPYGGPHGQRVMRNAAAFTTEQWIADQGFAVIVADGHGSPGRGPSWERDVLNDLATYPLADQVQALQALATGHADLDTDRVGIRGWSFGGYLAALAVLDRPDIFKAAVAGAPVTDWTLYDTAYTERYLGHPDTNPDAYNRTSLLLRANQLTRPLLMLHGLADDNVHVAHTLQLSSALLAAGKPHAVVPLTGVTHMTPQEIVAENLLRLEIDFFSEHLGVPNDDN